MDLYFKEKLKKYESTYPIMKEFLQTSNKAVINSIFSTHFKKKLEQQSKKKRVPVKTENKICESPTLEDKNNKSFRYLSNSDKKKLLKRLQAEKQKRKEKILADLESRQNMITKSLELEKLQEIQKKEKQKEEKLKKIKESQAKNLQKKLERDNEFYKSTKELKKVTSAKPLFKEIEEKFAVFVELPELEKRKKELSKRRELFAPMNPKEINTHEKKLRKGLRRKKAIKRRIKINELKTENSVNSKF
jgi:hypothetical protein